MTARLRTLLAVPSEATRDILMQQLTQVAARGELFSAIDIEHAVTTPVAKKMLESDRYDLCFVDEALGEDDQDFLIRGVARRLKPGHTAMIAMSHSKENENLLKLLQAGAKGILLLPSTTEAMAQVLRTALPAASDRGERPAHEEVNSLPWLLEHVAQRLSAVARQLREQDGNEQQTTATTKLVKEALLGVVGSPVETDDDVIRKLVEYLKRQS
ncbi:MAG: hypothetical protein U0136_04220 [Bdellovibrionota bacterium]